MVVALDAIGNLGPRDVPACVQDALKNDDAILRQKAIFSLQRIHTDTGHTMIFDAIHNDQPDNVRVAAACELLLFVRCTKHAIDYTAALTPGNGNTESLTCSFMERRLTEGQLFGFLNDL
jgi:hypothetical protein